MAQSTKVQPLVWVVSYPRSGNTFLRALLANYFSKLGRPLSLSEISASTMGEHDEALWTRLTGQPPAERSFEAQWRARGAYFRLRREAADRTPAIFKSHTLNGSVFGVPAFDFEPHDRIVHVVRHPCDVALSCADYWGVTLDQSIERLGGEGTVIDARPQHGFEVIGSWEQHTRSWLDGVGAPVRRIRYFDLVENTAETLRGVIEFLGETPDPRRLRAAAAFASFDTLSAQEDVAGFTEASQARSGRFFREGRALQWPEKLSEAQAVALTGPVADLLDSLGFTELMAQRRSTAG